MHPVTKEQLMAAGASPRSTAAARAIQHYVCGFLFSPDRGRVVLIRKRRPAWQAGKLNGVGGKLEAGETPIDAMRREFREEAAVDVHDWQHVLTLTGTDWQGHFFRAFGDISLLRA